MSFSSEFARTELQRSSMQMYGDVEATTVPSTNMFGESRKGFCGVGLSPRAGLSPRPLGRRGRVGLNAPPAMRRQTNESLARKAFNALSPAEAKKKSVAKKVAFDLDDEPPSWRSVSAAANDRCAPTTSFHEPSHGGRDDCTMLSPAELIGRSTLRLGAEVEGGSRCCTSPLSETQPPEAMPLYEGEQIQRAGFVPQAAPRRLQAPRITTLLSLEPSPGELAMRDPRFNDFAKAHAARCRRSIIEAWRCIVRQPAQPSESHSDDEHVVNNFLMQAELDCMRKRLHDCGAIASQLRQDVFDAELRTMQQEAELAVLRDQHAIISKQRAVAKDSGLGMQSQVEQSLASKFHEQHSALEEMCGEVSECVRVQRASVADMRTRVETASPSVPSTCCDVSQITVQGSDVNWDVGQEVSCSDGAGAFRFYSARLMEDSPPSVTVICSNMSQVKGQGHDAILHKRQDVDCSDGGSTRSGCSAQMSSGGTGSSCTSTVLATARSCSPAGCSASAKLRWYYASDLKVANVQSVGGTGSLVSAARPRGGCFAHQHFHTYARAEPKKSPLEFCCPEAHALSRFITPAQGFKCDSCSLVQPLGNVMFGCRQCDYDLCSSCYAYQETLESDAGDAASFVFKVPEAVEVPVEVVGRASQVSVRVEVVSRRPPMATR